MYKRNLGTAEVKAFLDELETMDHKITTGCFFGNFDTFDCIHRSGNFSLLMIKTVAVSKKHTEKSDGEYMQRLTSIQKLIYNFINSKPNHGNFLIFSFFMSS